MTDTQMKALFLMVVFTLIVAEQFLNKGTWQ